MLAAYRGPAGAAASTAHIDSSITIVDSSAGVKCVLDLAASWSSSARLTPGGSDRSDGLYGQSSYGATPNWFATYTMAVSHVPWFRHDVWAAGKQ